MRESQEESRGIRIPHDLLKGHENLIGNSAPLEQVGDNADIVIRRRKAAILDKLPGTPRSLSQKVDLLTNLHLELEKVRIPVIKFSIIGFPKLETVPSDTSSQQTNVEDKGEIFISTNRIATNYNRDRGFNEGQRIALVILWKKILKYLVDKWSDETLFLSDLQKPEQYVWGKQGAGQQNTFILVDVDAPVRPVMTLRQLFLLITPQLLLDHRALHRQWFEGIYVHTR